MAVQARCVRRAAADPGSGAAARARLDRLAELLDGIAQRLLLEAAAHEARHPEAEIDRLPARRRRAAVSLLEAILAVDGPHVALDERPRRAVWPIVGVVEDVANGLHRHVEHELDALRQPVGVLLEHATARDRRRPARVVLEGDEDGEAIGQGGGDGGRVRLAILAHGWPCSRRAGGASRAGAPMGRCSLGGEIRYAPARRKSWRYGRSNGETGAWS